jgi:flagellar biosynthesis/type III secretory pathway ATPase
MLESLSGDNELSPHDESPRHGYPPEVMAQLVKLFEHQGQHQWMVRTTTMTTTTAWMDQVDQKASAQKVIWKTT